MKQWQIIAAALALIFGAVYLGRNVLKNIIQKFEGLSLVPYKDSAGFWTIGYGHKIVPGDIYYPYGDVKEITEPQAAALLEQDMNEARGYVSMFVKVPLTQNQKDALTDLVYNIGAGNFSSSTLLKKLNAGDYAGAAAEFPRWNKSGGQVLPGLVSRRADEQALFMSA